MAVGAAVAGGFPLPAISRGRTIKLGYVTPKTGPLAAFAEADDFILSGVRSEFANGIKVSGVTHPVEILVKDTQSNPNRAAEVASKLILDDEIDLMLVSSAPETINPVSDQCELNEVPCISTVAPWQAWFFSRGGNPENGFQYTYHFFWGFEDIIAVFANMWDKVDSNRKVGGLFPNDADGTAWADTKTGAPPLFKARNYSVLNPGQYANLTDDFSAIIGRFKAENCQLITGAPIPPDFTTFWNQARQQGFRPKAASIAKAILFPSSVEALGKSAHNLSCEVWWSPSHPFQSSLTGASAGELATAFTRATGRQWTQPIGFSHALFEVAADVLARTEEIGEPAAVLKAIAETNLETVVGTIDWSSGPMRNVAKTPLVGAQLREVHKGAFPFDLVITSNETAPVVPAGGKMEALS